MGAQASVATTANIYNNSVYSAATGFYFGPSGTSVSLVNNAMNKTTVAFGTDGNGTFTEDYNDWGQSALFQIGSVQYQSAAWKGLHGGTHDLYEDPMWQSPGNRIFTLLNGSPCSAAGEDVGLPFSGAAPNMGAVQQPQWKSPAAVWGNLKAVFL